MRKTTVGRAARHARRPPTETALLVGVPEKKVQGRTQCLSPRAPAGRGEVTNRVEDSSVITNMPRLSMS
ncbi:hypothetical protein GCM10010326_04140 [Streptomyces xanthochromogenes]|uniref:Transposase n=1 Tax=Streptomyces xanthochromogenes TaxID=67384 RepID=A0ABQ2ZG00_9ACTN|nr:hypothetical protein GCM10010326_04140 [Streptomyces xanthochromogenes]